MVNAPAGSIGDRVAVADCVSGPRDLEDWIISLFEPLPGLLAGSAGHRESWLLTVRHPGPDRCIIISLTVWDSIGDYRRQERAGLAAVLQSARSDPQRSARLDPPRRYDLQALPLPEMTARILARVGADIPALLVGEASLRGLSWSASQTAPLRALVPGGSANRRRGLSALPGWRSAGG